MDAKFFENFNWFDLEQLTVLEREGGLDWARRVCPIPHTQYGGGAHILTRHGDVRTASRRPDLFSSRSPHIDPLTAQLPPFDLDPPLHRDFRALLNPRFSQSALERYRADLEQIADSLIDAFIDNGEVEFVSRYAIPFTSASLARVVLGDDNVERLAEGVEAITRISHGDPDGVVAIEGIARQLLAERAGAATPPDDLLSVLVTAGVDGGRPLTEAEQLGVVTILLIGGLETTNQAISRIGHYLAERDDIESRMRRPGWVRTDLEEFLRITSTVAVTTRDVTADNDVLACPLKEGDRIALYWLAGNRDPDVFADPDDLVFDRPSPSHLAFGDGIHRCVGQHFARLQIAVAFNRPDRGRGTSCHIRQCTYGIVGNT